MRKQFIYLLTAIAILHLGLASTGHAQAPNTIMYQGRLTDANGDPLTGQVSDVTFTIYRDPEPDVANPVYYTVTKSITCDDNGVFTTELGPITDPNAFSGAERYLGIKIGTDDEMTPYQVLTSTLYSMRVGNLPDEIRIGDSTMIANNVGIRIGDPAEVTPDNLVRIERDYNTTSDRYGLYSYVRNESNGALYAMRTVAVHTTASNSGQAFGLMAMGSSDGVYRWGVVGLGGSQTSPSSTGRSFGVSGQAYRGEYAYGVQGYATGATYNYAGQFDGNVRVSGNLSKGSGSFKIDHPLDPENKYLQHSFVESPDMMNVYNGNVITNGNGEAVVELPHYFEALNKDFRYQLTVIGDFAQAIIAEEINGNQFVIRTDKPNVKVSWQVTGIRKDAFAEANRIEVEVEKPPQERGKYLHPEAFGFSLERYVDYEMIKNAHKAAEQSNE